MAKPLKRIIDVHTHVYLPRYVDLLRSRTTVPRIIKTHQQEERLIILPNEDTDASTKSGRPIGREYYDISIKSKFMETHGIKTSVLSLANPWLDFLDKEEASEMATLLNKDLNDLCQSTSSSSSPSESNVADNNDGKFFGFGVLPNNDAESCVKELHHITKLDKMRGVILGTYGVGKGLDDHELIPVFETASNLGLTLFLHPHYGLPSEVYGSQPNGHVLPLALGFPFETTIAVSRLILTGIFDRLPNLKVLLAHSGGTIPFLAGRLDSCVVHDAHVRTRLQKKPSEYLKNLFYDAVSYHAPALKCCADLVGADRMMFGTDHPFFPPLDVKDPYSSRWESVDWNYEGIRKAFQNDEGTVNAVLGGNSERILDL